jgi:hypothetical protein
VRLFQRFRCPFKDNPVTPAKDIIDCLADWVGEKQLTLLLDGPLSLEKMRRR